MNRKYNIGIDIDQVCLKYNITNYTIREDGRVDVDGDVNLSGMKLTKLPLKFGIVRIFFDCSENNLTSLEGAPEKVDGHFDCYNNYLTTLKGAPKEVDGGFYCYNNNLISLEFAPVKVGGDFYCHNNNLTTLDGSPDYVGGHFDCYNNNLTTLEFAPEKVGGHFSCSYNNLTSLEYAPKEVGGHFSCFYNNLLDVEALVKCRIGGNLDITNNPISTIIKDIDIRDLDHFYLIRPLNGNKLSRSLYDEVRVDLGLHEFDYSKLHKDIELVD